MGTQQPHNAIVHELLYQALETELGGIQVYTAAMAAAVNDDLRDEWDEYLSQTRRHHEILLDLLDALGMDPDQDTVGRRVVAQFGRALVKAMEAAQSAGDPAAAQIVAAECVVLAETKDHLNWELIGMVARSAKGELARLLTEAHEKVEKEEDHHLYHTKGWTRELWIESLGLPAVLPPPEEIKQVETAIGASRAEQQREQMLKRH